ncbi:casc3/Barentsz eIF4AIII binding, partial [Halocaridina rubra]
RFRPPNRYQCHVCPIKPDTGRPISDKYHTCNMGSDGGESEYESADDEELGEEEEEEDDILILPDGVPLGDENKQLDDDEDRKNPQYIPKKGTFYEHDDRTAAEEDVEKPPEEPVVKKEASKKKVWKEDNKWNHDKFNEFDQAPKSREELIAIYGYDIRNEEGPPRARRRRRYGRGPNKYTRNWEDFDAYAKPARGGPVRGGIGRGGNRSLSGSKRALSNNEEFPALGSPQQQKHITEALEDLSISESQSPKSDLKKSVDDHYNENETPKQQISAHHHHHHQQNKNIASPQIQDARLDNYGGRGRGGRGSRGRGSGRGSNKEQHKYNDERGVNNYDAHSSGRGRGGYQPKGSTQQQSHSDDITLEMKNINLNSQPREERHKKNRGGGNSENRRNTVPPRLQESAAAAANLHGRGSRGNNSSGGDVSASSRPKRYSSQRQRSIPEQAVPPFQQQTGYIDPALEGGYQGGVYEGAVSPATSHTATAPHSQLPLAGGAPPSFVPPAFTSPPTFPPEPFLGRPPAPRMFPPVTQSPHIFAGGPLGAPPVGAPPVPPGPPVTGPPFIPHEINYAAHPGPQPGPHTGPLPGAAPLAGPHPPQFPPFQGFTPGPVSQPNEIYSNGVTYYNTESQQHLPRNNIPLQKRPKAAIPIVPPPEKEQREQEAIHASQMMNEQLKSDTVSIVDESNVEVYQDHLDKDAMPLNSESQMVEPMQEAEVEESDSKEEDDLTEYEAEPPLPEATLNPDSEGDKQEEAPQENLENISIEKVAVREIENKTPVEPTSVSDERQSSTPVETKADAVDAS